MHDDGRCGRQRKKPLARLGGPAAEAIRKRYNSSGLTLLARKLKTFVTSLGFFELAVAAPSMKAALEAWGVKHNVFHQGFASETDDPEIVAAAMAKPGTVLRRPVGTDEPFREDAVLPKGFSLPAIGRPAASPKPKPKAKEKKPKASRGDDTKAEHAAIISFEKARKERQRALAEEERAARKAREKRLAATEKAEQAIADARKDHQSRLDRLERERAQLDRRVEDEHARWNRERAKLESALDRARRS